MLVVVEGVRRVEVEVEGRAVVWGTTGRSEGCRVGGEGRCLFIPQIRHPAQLPGGEGTKSQQDKSAHHKHAEEEAKSDIWSRSAGSHNMDKQMVETVRRKSESIRLKHKIWKSRLVRHSGCSITLTP